MTAVPDLVAAAVARWGLEVDAPFEPGVAAAWVAPATRRGAPCVLKVAHPHAEATHEADGLRLLRGDGAVRLLDAFEVDSTPILLLERCTPGTALTTRPGPEQDRVIAALLHRLWRVGLDGVEIRSLQQMCDAWADSFEARPTVVVDPGLARVGIALLRELPATASRSVLLCTDVHAGNVLAAEREPWLMIDPKPHIGDPTYDAVQHMLNCPDRLQADPDALCSRMADLLDLDVARLRLWLFARCVQESGTWPGLAELVPRLAP